MIKTIAAYEYEVNAHFVVEQLRHAGLKAEYNKNELEIETEYVVRVLEEDASRAMAILEGLTIDDSFVEEGVDILEILHEEQKYILEEAEYDEGDSIFGYKLLGPLFIIVGLTNRNINKFISYIKR